MLAPEDEIDTDTLAAILSPADPLAITAGPMTLPESGVDLAELERDLIRQALERTGGNRTQAAALLGLSRDTLRYRMEKFQLD